jgi:hypothetical protein
MNGCMYSISIDNDNSWSEVSVIHIAPSMQTKNFGISYFIVAEWFMAIHSLM